MGTRLLAGMAGVAMLLVLTACSASPEERIASARQYLEQGDAPSAIIELKNVLQDDPVNLQARELLARASLQAGDAAGAAKEFERAVDLGAGLDQVGADYAEALVRAGASEQALAIVAEVPVTEDNAGRLEWIRGMALVGLGRLDEAEAAFAAAAERPETELAGRIGLARVANARGDRDEALARLDAMAELGADNSEYWEIRGFTLMAAGEPEAAAEALQKSIQNANEAFGGRRFVLRGARVEALLAAGDLASARQIAERMLAEAKQHPMPNYLMSRVELQSGNPQQALAYAQAVLAGQPDSGLGNTMAGAASLALSQPVQAEQYLARAVEDDPSNVTARKLLAQVRLGLGSPEEAREALEPLVALGGDAQAATLSGMASVRAGDPQAAIELLRRQLESDPDNATLRNALAVSLLSAGRTDEALAELARVSPADEAARLRADLLEVAARIQEPNPPEARAAASRIASERPDDVGVRNALGGLFLSANAVDDAIAWFEDALTLDPGNPVATFNLGRIDAAQGRIEAARGRFESVLASDPDNAVAKTALAQLAWAQDNRAEAISILQEVRGADPAAFEPRLLLARFLMTTGEPVEALAVAREAANARPRDARAAEALGEALLATGQTQEALAEFRRANEIVPGSPRYLVDEALALTRAGSWDAARRSFLNALAIDPDYLPALFPLVDLERRSGRLEAAAEVLDRVRRITPADDPRVSLLEGELALASGDLELARSAMERAVEGDLGGRAVVGLWQVRRLAGEDNAETTLMSWLAENPDDNLVRTLLANELLNAGRYDEAIRQYEELHERSPASGVVLNNLAWLYAEVGDDRALATAEEAYRLAPENGAVLDTYGWLMHRSGQSERALELLRQAVQRSPDLAEIRYHYAVVLAENGRDAEAIREARTILADEAAVPYHDEAQALLQKLGAAQGD